LLLTSYANPKEALMMMNNFNILVVSFVGMEKMFRALLGVLLGARRQGSREVVHGMCSNKGPKQLLKRTKPYFN
jgi:hypothetical protein